MRPDRETLHRLYVDDRLTTRQIGAKYGVAHITINRWLTAYGIEKRDPMDRGVTPPTRDALHDLVHVQHRSYREIAATYGVDFTVVPYWLDKHGIERPGVWDTRRRGIEPVSLDLETVRGRLARGESLNSIADSVGATRSAVKAFCVQHGLPTRRDGWEGGRRLTCTDGHLVRSTYELRVDDWLTEHGLAHELEPRYPFDKRYRADFRVQDAYIEVWGVIGNERYKVRKAWKIEQCRIHGLRLIQINVWQFAGRRQWWRPLLQLVDGPGA